MKKSKILMLFLIIGLIIILFSGCIPTIPSSPSEIIDAENYNKNNDIVLGIPYYSAEGINNGCLCAAGAMLFGYYGFNVLPQELADYGLLMFPETTLNDEFGLFTELKRYAISNLNLKAKYGFLSIKKIKNEIDKGVPIIVLQYSNFPRIIPNLHYRVIHGYNDTEQKFVVSCAQGTYYDLSYSDFLHLNLIENVDKCPSMIIESNNLDVEADVDPKNGTPPHEVHCVGFASGGPMPYTYQWEFGDGNWSEKGMDVEHKNVFHTYLKSGKYTPILHVEDSSGNMGKCTAGVVTVEKKIPFIDGSVFANKQWIIDTDESPGSNLYSDSIENIWLDELGQLHFRMTRDKETKRWKCIEIYSDQQEWGYGKYEFEIEVVSDGKIDENVVIGLFAYDNSITAHKSNNELDIEFSRWGNPNADNGNFVVWYDTTEGDEKRNLCTFSLQLVGNSSIHSFEWTNDNIIFDSSEITFCPLYPESFTYLEGDNVVGPNGDGYGYGYIPIPNKERVYINLWLHNGNPYNEDKMEEVELVIKDFKFTPTLCGPVHNLTKNTYYNTIQAAIDVANSGDTIEVSPRTYSENISFLGKNITLQSINPDDPSVVASTIIDGGGNGSVVTFISGETAQAELSGFTIQNGYPGTETGGGIFIISSSPVISNNIVKGNITHSDHGGGGIFIAHSASPLIQDNHIQDNQGGYGGGIYVGDNSSPTIHNNTIENNLAEIHRGGGIFISGSSSPTIQDNSLSDNSSQYGGGICIVENSSGEITNNYFTLNTAQYGGGIFCGEDSDPIIKQNEFSGNSATRSGGGLFIGGCICVSNNNIISGNTAQFGGGICVWESSPIISNNTINGNTATAVGGGIIISSNSHPTINNNIISLNKATSYGGGLYIDGISSVKTTNGSTWPRQNTPPNAEATNTYFDNTHGNPLDYTEGADVYMVGAITPPQTIEPPVNLINICTTTENYSPSDTSKARDIFNINQSDNRTAIKFLDDNTGLIRGDSIYHYIGPWWEAYPNAGGYRVYRKINDSNYELIYDWDVSDPEYNDSVVFRVLCVVNPEIGDTFSFYVVAYNNSENWETVTGIPLEKTIDNETFLPPIYLNQPQEYGEVNNSNYLFQWTPVGVILPYGDIIEGYTHIIVFDDDYTYYWYGSFNDFTTSQAAYNGDTLVPGNTYNWRVTSYGFNAAGIESIASSRSQVWKFTYTGTSVESPTVITVKADNITKTSAKLYGNITDTGGENADQRGFAIHDLTEGIVVSPILEDGSFSTGEYNLTVSGLTPGHLYQFAAYAKNSHGSDSGDWIEFTTNDINPPTVSNLSAINITQTSATIRGRIDDNGGEDADMYRWSYREKGGDTYNIPSDIGNYPVGNYALNMNDYLSPGRTYEFSFNAKNSAGWSNNSWREFTTLPSIKELNYITVSPSYITMHWPEMLQGDFDYTVTAHYKDGTSQVIKIINCIITSNNPDAVYVLDNFISAVCKYADSAVVTIAYTENSITRTTTINITVEQVPGSICVKIVNSSGNLVSGSNFGYVLFRKVSNNWEYVKEVGGQESRYVFVSLSAGTYKIDFYDYATYLGTKENVYLSSSEDTEVAMLIQ